LIPRRSASFRVKLAESPDDICAAQRLRYEVFVAELGAQGPQIDHEARLEADAFDAHCDHLLLMDDTENRVAGVYRLMRSDQAAAAGGFYSAGEYDLSPLESSGRRLLELGRSCLHPDYRGGSAMHTLWSGLAEYVAEHEIEVLFGVASFQGTDVAALAQPLSLLHHNHLAPEALRVQARAEGRADMQLVAPEQLDRRAAMLQVPSLIKAYLRLGGFVGQGAFVDHGFNTTDVCLIMDTARMNERQARIYGGGTP